MPAPYVPPGWDDWVSPSGGNPYAEYHYELNENGKLVQYGHKPADYLVDVLAKKATDFIRQQRGQAAVLPVRRALRPTPARHAGTALRQRVPRRTGAAHAVVRPGRRRRRAVVAPRPAAALPGSCTHYIDRLYRRRLQDMLGVEDLLAQSRRRRCKQSGQLDNTYIFFRSDNGFHLGQHRLPPGKQTPFEEDIHVPLSCAVPACPTARPSTGSR